MCSVWLYLDVYGMCAWWRVRRRVFAVTVLLLFPGWVDGGAGSSGPVTLGKQVFRGLGRWCSVFYVGKQSVKLGGLGGYRSWFLSEFITQQKSFELIWGDKLLWQEYLQGTVQRSGDIVWCVCVWSLAKLGGLLVPLPRRGLVTHASWALLTWACLRGNLVELQFN